MKLETIRLLADDGSPLEVTLEKTEKETLLTRGGVTVSEHPSDDPLQDLSTALTHYPGEVWINGEKLDTTPWPGLGKVSMTDPDDSQKSRKVELGEKTPGDFINAYVGGITIRMNLGWLLRKKTTNCYFTPSEGKELHHHTPLSSVEVQAILEIDAREVNKMKQTIIGPEVPENSLLEERIVERAEAMIQRTMERPEMPPRYDGKVYGRPTKGEWGSEHYDEPYAIGVEGRPIVITQEEDGGYMDNAVFVTIVENLYRDDSELAPVMEWGGGVSGTMIPGADDDMARTREVTFDIKDHTGHPAWAESITMRIEMEDGTVNLHDCSFHLEGTAEWEASARIVPGRMGKEDIAALLTQAYWTDRELNDWDEMKQAREDLEEQMGILAEHLMGNTDKAVRDEMQLALDRIHPTIPFPEEKITLTSRDGRLQLTLNP